MKINFTNIILFFILLVVCLLLISYYGFFGKWEYFGQEGFISFKVDKNPLVGDIVIPTYSPSSRVYKLYDNLFFDNTNGNLIQANGKPAKQDNKDVIDNDGTSLSSIVVYNRDSSIQSVTINTELSEDLISNSASQQSKKTGYDVSFSQFIISNLNGNTTDNYQTLYVAWGKRTFIDVINTSVSPPITLLGALFTDTNLQGHLVPEPLIPADDAKIKIVPSEYVQDANDGRLNTQSWYENKKLFQVCSFLHYDINNGNIVIRNYDDSVERFVGILDRQLKMVHRRDGVIEGGISNTLPSVEYVVRSFQFDPNMKAGSGNLNPTFFIYYVGFGKRTILIVLRKQSQTNDMFKIVKVARFDKDGYVEPTSSTRVEPSVPVQSENTNVDYDVSQTDIGLFGIDILLAQQIDYIQENYVKKTDMVAPIYPTVLSCPSCSGSNDGVCNNCGGNGGSGTKGTKDKEKEKDEKDTVSDVKDGVVGFGNNIVGGAVDLGKSTLDLGKQAVAGTVDLGKSTVGGAVDLTKQGVSGAASMADRAVTGTVDLGRETVGGAVDLTKQAASGAVDLSKQAASGAINQLNYMTTIRGGNGGQGTGYGGQGTGYGGQGTGNGGQGTAYNGGPGTASNGGQRGVPINYNTSGTVPGVDNYSGYGALVNKGQDFMPLTASFSAFGK